MENIKRYVYKNGYRKMHVSIKTLEVNCSFYLLNEK